MTETTGYADVKNKGNAEQALFCKTGQ